MARSRRKKKTRSRKVSLKLGFAATAFLVVWGAISQWYVHHPRAWLEEKDESWPKMATSPLLWFGNPLADITDSLGWTGYDTVYEYDEAPPSGKIVFAGIPVRTGAPAPTDIRVLDRGEFLIGWSDSLKHPLWCAYHVPAEALYDIGERPGFTKDPSVPSAPKPGEYSKSGYDRGHMVPNYAIITRFGEEARKKTFRMSNISPQSPSLNRGVWREMEHRIADLWTRKYGEIWVVVGCIPDDSGEKIPGSGIDIPSHYYQVVIAQKGMDVRALAFILKRDAAWGTYAARHIISIDELEKMTGLDFNPDLPRFIQDPLEAQTPSRLWPVRPLDIFRQIALHFR